MGVNYGHRRPRLEPLRIEKFQVAYALGQAEYKFSHMDEQEIWHEVNRRLDKVQDRVTNLSLV